MLTISTGRDQNGPVEWKCDMSFMFNPHPYDDPQAINRIKADEALKSSIVSGSVACARAVIGQAQAIVGKRRFAVLAVDGYVSAPLEAFAGALGVQGAIAGTPCAMLPAADLFQSEEALEKIFKESLPEDAVVDPPQLYGKVYGGGYEGLFDPDKVEALAKKIEAFRAQKQGVLVVYGNGILIDRLRALFDYAVFMDVTPKRAVLNIKSGKTGNFGTNRRDTYTQMLRHAYYIDFEAACELRGKLLKDRAVDAYIAADDFEQLRLLPLDRLYELFDLMLSYPFRCRPVYIEGVWGGFYIKRLRRLPDTMRNVAWVFDMIPLEVSIVADMDGLQVEFPYFTFVQVTGPKLMGDRAHRKFNGYFPIRFNYDDTFHASGNMSIQVHPPEKYVLDNYRDLGRQDESYYIVQTGQDAKTYIGFRDGADAEAFIAKAKESERTGQPFDHDDYVYSRKSEPGMQFMLPAGTIHASGRNQLILEIGSLTIGSYTYKMYDYCRKDIDGKPRPIHSYHGDKVLRRDYTQSWVGENLIQPRSLVREGEGFAEYIVGQHDLLYFSLRNVVFDRAYEDDTGDRFHVLVLVDGEKVQVRSKGDPSKCFTQQYLDMVVVPASFGPYEVVNMGPGTVTIHKTMLKEGFEGEP